VNADLYALPGPRLVLLASEDLDSTGEPCALCGQAALPGPILAVLDLGPRAGAITCTRCAREADPVIAALAEALNTVATLAAGLDDEQHVAGLRYALDVIAEDLPDPAERNSPCPS
jgi:hypothetical protein